MNKQDKKEFDVLLKKIKRLEKKIELLQNEIMSLRTNKQPAPIHINPAPRPPFTITCQSNNLFKMSGRIGAIYE